MREKCICAVVGQTCGLRVIGWSKVIWYSSLCNNNGYSHRNSRIQAVYRGMLQKTLYYHHSKRVLSWPDLAPMLARGGPMGHMCASYLSQWVWPELSRSCPDLSHGVPTGYGGVRSGQHRAVLAGYTHIYAQGQKSYRPKPYSENTNLCNNPETAICKPHSFVNLSNVGYTEISDSKYYLNISPNIQKHYILV